MAEWVDKAACKRHPMSIFYPETGHGSEEAKRICALCPVQKPCLEFAIETNQQHGIWAGMTARERQAFEDKRARSSGTIQGRPALTDRPLADRQIWTADGR